MLRVAFIECVILASVGFLLFGGHLQRALGLWRGRQRLADSRTAGRAALKNKVPVKS